MDRANPLVGAWRLVAMEYRYPDGRVRYSYGCEAKVAAFETYLSYAGRYEFPGDRVLHHVEVALIPGWVGTTLMRLAHFEGDRLLLSMEQDTRGRVTVITWERAASA